MTTLRVWAPRPSSVEVEVDGTRTALAAAGRRLVDRRGRRPRHRLRPRARRRRPAARPAQRLAAARGARPVPGGRPRRLRLDRPDLARHGAARQRALRAARRHVHAGGHLRRGRRAARPPGGARRSARSSCCPATPSPAGGAGATTASPGSPCTSPTAVPTGSSASSTPATPAASASSWTSSTTTSARPGNYLPEFGPYLTEDHTTPWGPAVNLDRPGSDEVRRYVLDNALMWLRDYHVDGLRIDAVHALVDERATHLLEELSVEVEALGAQLHKPLFLIAESDLNDAAHGELARGRRARARRAVGRRRAPRAAREPDRRDRRLLRRLRAACRSWPRC